MTIRSGHWPPAPKAIRESPLPPSAWIHLQWFSDDAEAEGKTEQPTEHKLRKLREEEGQVPKSQEVSGAATLFLPAILLLFIAPHMLRTCVEMIRFFLTRATELDPTQDAIIVGVFFSYMARLLAPIFVVAVIAALVSNYVQVGAMFATKPITPNFTKVIPRFGQFFKRIFSSEGVFNFVKSIIKMVLIGGVAYTFIRMDFEKLVNLQRAGLWQGLTTVASIAIRMLITCSLLLMLLSIPDFLFQRWRFKERNKMSKHEIKEEMKMYEGDPQVKGRIKSRFRELLKQNLTTAIPKADVVITNPTHYAVALEYQKETMPSPMVTAKGSDNIAAQIRKLAEENGVPMVENKPLAQALYREMDVGTYIPREYFTIVGTILARVYHINERRRKAAAAKATAGASGAA
ncbi:MAG: flagellar biosynthesis protein FlhB [Treponema sp.]|nr:flagellar biosynthesis protein FlhB [Treponema sp.]